jgi:hypothetical protein
VGTKILKSLKDLKETRERAVSIRILIVDDFEPWRRFVCSMIREEPGLQIICEVSDGQAAIHKAKEVLLGLFGPEATY